MSRKWLAPPQSASARLGGNGQAREDFRDGTVENGVGDGQQAHQEKVGALGGMPAGWDMASQKKPRVKAVRISSRCLAGGHGHDGEDGDPAAKFDFTDQLHGFANAVNFAAKAEQRRVQIAQELIDQRRDRSLRSSSTFSREKSGAETAWRR